MGYVWAAAAVVALGALFGGEEPARLVLAEGDGAAIVRRDTPSGAVIRISGELSHSDAAAYAAAAGSGRALVELDSTGGSVSAALAIGRAIYAHGGATFVPEGGTCLSACGLIWLAGAPRLYAPGADIGFHAAYTSEDDAKVERGAPNALIGAYLAGLGLSERVIWEVTRAAPDEMMSLSRDFLADTGLLATRLPRGADAANAYAAMERARIVGPAALAIEGAAGAADPQMFYGTARWTVVDGRSGSASHVVADLTLAGPLGPVRVSVSRNADDAFDAALVVGVSGAALDLAALTGFSVRSGEEAYAPLDAPYRWEQDGTVWLSLGRRHSTAATAALDRAEWLSISARLADGRTAAITFAKGANWTARMSRQLLAAL